MYQETIKRIDMKKLIMMLFTTSLLFSSLVSADDKVDRSKEIDNAYAKLVQALPKGAQIIHSPYVESYQTYGPNLSSKILEDSGAAGGKSLLVEIKKKGKNPWDDAVFADIGAEVAKGDVLYVMVFMRGEAPGQGSSIKLRGGIQMSGEPYSEVLVKDIELVDDWQAITMAGVIGDDFKANDIRVNFPVSQRRQDVEFGPAFVFKLPKGIDPKSLPYLTN
jgi:hypothetical protein